MENLKKYRKAKGLSQKELAESVGVSESFISQLENSKKMPSFEVALKLAEVLDCESADLVSTRGNKPTITDSYVSFPVIGEVAAGYNHFGEEDWTNGEVDIPSSCLNGRSCDEYFVLRVTGDSMYPLYQDGDIVLVHSQPVLDHNGQIAVVRYEDVNATLKRVEQGENVVKLYPVNPQFPPLVIRGVSLTQYSILGIPKMLIRNLQ